MMLSVDEVGRYLFFSNDTCYSIIIIVQCNTCSYDFDFDLIYAYTIITMFSVTRSEPTFFQDHIT